MRDLDSGEGRRGLLEWAAPVIIDRLREVYERRLGVGDDAAALARLHNRVWRALIAADAANYAPLRAALVDSALRCRLDLACLDEADAQTMAELLDIVVKRFQRSERNAKSYQLALMEVAERLIARSDAA